MCWSFGMWIVIKRQCVFIRCRSCVCSSIECGRVVICFDEYISIVCVQVDRVHGVLPWLLEGNSLMMTVVRGERKPSMRTRLPNLIAQQRGYVGERMRIEWSKPGSWSSALIRGTRATDNILQSFHACSKSSRPEAMRSYPQLPRDCG